MTGTWHHFANVWNVSHTSNVPNVRKVVPGTVDDPLLRPRSVAVIGASGIEMILGMRQDPQYIDRLRKLLNL